MNKTNTASSFSTPLQRLTLGAILTALVVVLQLLGQFIHFGVFSISLVLIPIVVGAAGTNGNSSTNGGETTAFSASAAGGKCSAGGTSNKVTPGGKGGSGGGGSGSIPYGKAAGGTDGSDGTDGSSKGGTGQGTTTREFGEANGDLYASGGGSNLTATVANSGNGGKYSPTTSSIAAADGIVVIRQHKEVAA